MTGQPEAAAGAPLCSICIANYNGAEVLEDCLESVFSQQPGFPIEVIVHDDASTDGSADIARDRYPDIVLIRSQNNVGFCASNNRMAAVARGKYLLLLNNDATLMSGALAALKNEAERIERPAILGLPQYDAESGELLDIGSLLDPFLNPVPNRDAGRAEVAMVAGACLWIPCALWQDLGGFPEWFGSIGEDLYLCSLARLQGHPVRALGTSGYRHRVGASFGGGKVKNGKLVTVFSRRALSERNKTFVMAMTYPAPAMQLLLPVHLLLLLIEGIALTVLQGRRAYLTQIYLPVFAALFRQRGVLMNQRKTAMSRRKSGLRNFFSVFGGMPHKLRMLLRYGLPQVK